MKGTFFNKPLEWNIETDKESWSQGDEVKGVLRVKNHGPETVSLQDAGVALAHAEIKKVHARSEGALKFDVKETFPQSDLDKDQTIELPFSLILPANCPVTDKKASYYLSYGRDHTESHLMLKIEPNPLFGKVIGLLDTFQRFKLKEFKSGKNGVEYKLIPPTSREMANLDSLILTLTIQEKNLQMDYDFQVRKLDTAGVTTKVNKVGVKLSRNLLPKEYSLGYDMINQDALLKSIESVMGEVKLKSVF